MKEKIQFVISYEIKYADFADIKEARKTAIRSIKENLLIEEISSTGYNLKKGSINITTIKR